LRLAPGLVPTALQILLCFVKSPAAVPAVGLPAIEIDGPVLVVGSVSGVGAAGLIFAPILLLNGGIDVFGDKFTGYMAGHSAK
jgi:hypothetical protein